MSATAKVRKYITKHPSIRDCLAKDLINFSALARKICGHHPDLSFDAVLMACRRYQKRFKQPRLNEKSIMSLVKKAKTIIRNKMLVAIIERPRDFEKLNHLRKDIKASKGAFNLVEGQDVITIITNAEYAPLIRKKFASKIVRFQTNLAQISVVFGKKLEDTPGVVAYIYGLLAENGINIIEELSCWTDLIVIIDERDLNQALKILS